ncbi:unnamed protein product [Darwinula stevensoni]|uniref:Mediator complex subunit 16 C-terminal domain-containing protein n=1 Tax=Darwinula stevensoni TaxID=69355 RepID=A0A7R9A909_9CRUS|nr:unnamed protein product [Darwinula stevensoni]CAG0896956.1 unnamed protein product [Darwinula stevensoni]
MTEECCLLPTQVLVPNLQLSFPPRGVAAALPLFPDTLPLQFEFGCEPDSLPARQEAQTSIDGISELHLRRDCVHHVYLGSKHSLTKRCTRCTGESLSRMFARTAAARAWDQRWIRSCPCSGHWTIAYHQFPAKNQ